MLKFGSSKKRERSPYGDDVVFSNDVRGGEEKASLRNDVRRSHEFSNPYQGSSQSSQHSRDARESKDPRDDRFWEHTQIQQSRQHGIQRGPIAPAHPPHHTPPPIRDERHTWESTPQQHHQQSPSARSYPSGDRYSSQGVTSIRHPNVPPYATEGAAHNKSAEAHQPYAKATRDVKPSSFQDPDPFQGRSGAKSVDELNSLGFWEQNEASLEDPSEGTSDKRAPMRFFIALLVFCLLVGGGIAAYRYLFSSQRRGEPVFIQADSGPIRVAPGRSDAGGAQNMSVYDRVVPIKNPSEPQVERLLPPPDQPIVVPNEQRSAPPIDPRYQGYAYPPQQVHQPQVPQQQMQQVPIQQPQQGQQLQAQVYQQPLPQFDPRQQQQAPQPYQNVDPNAHAYQQQQGAYYPPQPQQQYRQAAAPYPSPYEQQPLAYPQPQQAYPPQNRYGEGYAQEELPPIVNESEQAPSNVSPTDQQPFFLQMGSFSTKEAADQEVTRLRSQYKTELFEYEIFPRRTSNGKYRVLSGPFPSKDEALRKRSRIGLRCLVVDK